MSGEQIKRYRPERRKKSTPEMDKGGEDGNVCNLASLGRMTCDKSKILRIRRHPQKFCHGHTRCGILHTFLTVCLCG